MKEHINETIDKYLNTKHKIENISSNSNKSIVTDATPSDAQKARYPWHMPGHKRKPAPWELNHDAGEKDDFTGDDRAETGVLGRSMFNEIFSRDLTEVPGLDDLHYPTEMIKLSMEELAKVYGSYKTYYLVNGATCGNLAAIFACVKGDAQNDKTSAVNSGRYDSDIWSNRVSSSIIGCDGNNGANDIEYGTDHSKSAFVGKSEHIAYDSYSEKNIKNKKQKAVIIARNCHKSVFNAMQLLDVKPIYVYPKISNEMSIDGEIRAEDIRKAVERNSQLDIRCCVITSPTYEGVISDIRSISEVLHEAGIPLIVDEAHGAHFPFYESSLQKNIMNYDEIESNRLEKGKDSDTTEDAENQADTRMIGKNDYPCSALYLGADIVIQSLHKTLPSLTQTAVLHVSKSSINDKQNIGKYLSIFQSSSPSYIFLQTMEKCISWCDANRNEFKKHYERILRFREAFKDAKLNNVRLFEFKPDVDNHINSDGLTVDTSAVSDYCISNHISQDLTRLVFMVDGITGRKAAQIMEERYGLVFEMAGTDYITAISTVADEENDLQELLTALIDLDKYISDNKEEISETGGKISISLRTDEGVLPLKKAAGKRITDYIYVYPPGIPIIAPYEIITDEHIKEVYHSAICGYEIRSSSNVVIMNDVKKADK